MADRVRYYSTYDLSIPFELERADKVIARYQEGWRPEGVNDVIELFNIWQFVANGIVSSGWAAKTVDLIRLSFKDQVVRYFSSLTKDNWVTIYRQAEIEYKECFWKILDMFNIDGLLDLDTIREAISGHSWELRDLLKHKRLVTKNQKAVVSLLKENERAAEWLLEEYVEDDRKVSRATLYFPKALSDKDKEDIISVYLDSAEPNLNYVRLVLLARKDSNLSLSDETRLKASRLERKLNDEYFKPEQMTEIKYSVLVSGEKGKPLKWLGTDEDGNQVLCYSKEKMLEFKGADLLDYIRCGFEFLTLDGFISLVAKESDSDVLERVSTMNSRYSYLKNLAFGYKEAISQLQIESLQIVLKEEGKGRTIESSVKEFYEIYLKERYGYPSGILTLADNSADWVTKCRVIAPEIDAIAHRYNQFAERGEIDEELLRISSKIIRVTDVKSATAVRYYSIKGRPDELYRLFHLLFSDQSMLTFVDPYKNMYDSFFQLILNKNGQVCYLSYAQYQQRDIDYLIDMGYLRKDSSGMLFIEKIFEVYLLRRLYEYQCCPVHTFGGETGDELLEGMGKKGWLETDNHLLSELERNYFDYYLYNTKYTNGPALRNRYVHGSNADASKENVHRYAYYRLLILLILELLKIEDDLSHRQ